MHLAPYGPGAIVYDTVTETAHLVDAHARAVLTGDADDRLGIDAPEADGPAPAEGTDRTEPDQLEADGHASAGGDDRSEPDQPQEDLHRLGLVGRTTRPGPVEPVTLPGPDPEPDHHVGATHVIFDLRFAFAGPDPELIETLDRLLGTPVDEPADTIFPVLPDDTGVDLHVDTHWRFPDRGRLLQQLPTALNRIAARSDHHPVLHAAGVRTPGGHVLLITGEPDAGKSTLTSHLVRAGCDYLGDESVAVLADQRILTNPKPLTLKNSHVLPMTLRPDTVTVVGPVGPVHAIIETRYDPHHAGPPDLVELDADRAIRRVLANTLNLARSGERGLRILADLTWHTPVLTATHGDGENLAAMLIQIADS